MEPSKAPVAEAPMSSDILDNVKSLWRVWDVRLIVILSLGFQFFLLFLGPLRKRTSKGYVHIPLWLFYLLSPSISTYGLALMLRSLMDIKKNTYDDISNCFLTDNGRVNNHPFILSFWCSFLVLHMGGPDTITAFSLEDNQLWLRNYLNFIPYFYFLGSGTGLTIIIPYFFPCQLILLWLGIYRYCNWIVSLSISSMMGMPDVYPEIIWLKAPLNRQQTANLTDIQVLQHAYGLFTHFRGLIIDYRFKFKDCMRSRNFFLTLTSREAFRITERELNFFYESLYTKDWVVQKRSSYISRLVEFFSLWVVLLLFYLVDKSKFVKVDIGITYLLLFGSIFLDASVLFIILNTDWSIAYLKSGGEYGSSLIAKKLKQLALTLTRKTSLSSWWQKMANHRWSKSFSQYNLISHCLRPSMARFDTYKGTLTKLKNKLEEILHVENVKFNECMENLIIEQLRNKSLLADGQKTSRDIQSARGDWILSRDEGCNHLLQWIKDDIDFDSCLLMWHIATDLCFHTDGDANTIDGGGDLDKKEVFQDLSKWFSDYLLYLLIWQPGMISTISALGERKYGLIVSHVRNYFVLKNIKMGKGEKLIIMREACQSILLGYTTNMPDASEENLLIASACGLAIELKKLGAVRKWEVLCKVWIEMLCYAASHCKGSAHMSQLKEGGQLITFVWLLMVHFGLVN